MDKRFENIPELYWRLDVEQGFQNLGTIDLEDMSKVVASTAAYLMTSSMIRTLDKLAAALGARRHIIPVLHTTGRVQLPEAFQGSIEVIECPPPTSYFTGRKILLQKMELYFEVKIRGCRIWVLRGIGGGGKTQLALQFVDLHRERCFLLLLVCSSVLIL
jgi:hypothetical protein